MASHQYAPAPANGGSAYPGQSAIAPSWNGSRQPAPTGYQPQMTQSVNVNVGGPNIAFVQSNKGPGLFVRAIYFLFVGWYLGGIWIFLSYLMLIPIVTIPVFAKMINMLPQVMTLRPRTTNYQMRQQDGMMIVEESTAEQHPFWMRALYFVFFGLWFSAVWLAVAYVLSLTVIGLPLAFLMFNRTGAVATLYKN
jgi:uncharacterized membrane protein YccF (DUF307 family)